MDIAKTFTITDVVDFTSIVLKRLGPNVVRTESNVHIDGVCAQKQHIRLILIKDCDNLNVLKVMKR